ncbi:MAG: OsmC family protein [Kiritimatiellae bacterium]|nr:OsmC family protein [Kiritimatiellia bacterium]MDW8459488.1 OsmC family protein [Verrucomicrobiota bacterium]
MWTYETSLVWNADETGTERALGRPDWAISSPPEFGGKSDKWNPELMLVASVESCLMLTALSVAKRQKIEIKAYSSRATGQMAKTADGLRFTEIRAHVILEVDLGVDPARAEQLIRIAEKYCPVSNALKCPLHVTVEVHTR